MYNFIEALRVASSNTEGIIILGWFIGLVIASGLAVFEISNKAKGSKNKLTKGILYVFETLVSTIPITFFCMSYAKLPPKKFDFTLMSVTKEEEFAMTKEELRQFLSDKFSQSFDFALVDITFMLILALMLIASLALLASNSLSNKAIKHMKHMYELQIDAEYELHKAAQIVGEAMIAKKEAEEEAEKQEIADRIAESIIKKMNANDEISSVLDKESTAD